MLEPADLLLLDEPTNDLDIPTLEILEESLLEFRGALVLVTHDRYLLDRVSTTVLGLDGRRKRGTFCRLFAVGGMAAGTETTQARSSVDAREGAAAAKGKKKLSYLEAREFDGIEERIAAAEQILENQRPLLEDPAVATDADGSRSVLAAQDEAQSILDRSLCPMGRAGRQGVSG